MTKKNNALWFFVALLGGGTAVWWAKSAVADAWFAAMVAASVVLALMIYYLLNDEDAPEEEGDNVYYLGLLFTLISLMFTLVELFGADTDAARNAERVRVLLENFGIALTSTVVGIAGRVALQNWQRAASPGTNIATEGEAIPPVPPPGASTQDLEGFNRHVLERIARDLTQGANALARFHRIVRSHATDSEDYLLNHSETLKRESAEFKDTLQRSADSFVQELKDQAKSAFQTVEDCLGAVTQQAEALLDRIQTAHDDYLVGLRETTRSFHSDIRSSTDQNIDALRHSFDAAAQHAQALPSELRSAHDGYVASIRETAVSFQADIQSAASQNLDTLQRSFEAAAKRSLTLGQNLSNVDQRVDKAFDNLESGLERAINANGALGNSADQAAKSTAILQAEIQKLHAALAPLQAGAESVTSLLGSVEEFNSHIRAGRDTERAAELLREIGKTLETVTAEADTSAQRAARTSNLLDAFKQVMQTTEGEARRAAEALGALANAAEARAKTLRENQRSGFGFWNRRQ